jgi:hypothetical protein
MAKRSGPWTIRSPLRGAGGKRACLATGTGIAAGHQLFDALLPRRKQ